MIHLTIERRRLADLLKEKIKKIMHKLVFFIFSNDRDCGLASNICNLYMNRFTIDEDSGHEIVKIYEVEGLQRNSFHSSIELEEQIGMGHIIIF